MHRQSPITAHLLVSAACRSDTRDVTVALWLLSPPERTRLSLPGNNNNSNNYLITTTTTNNNNIINIILLIIYYYNIIKINIIIN